MPKLCYIEHTFGPAARAVIERANEICAAYAAQGYDLTLRQLYYQFVARGLIPNRDSEYKKLGAIINDARLAGLLDWNYIVDRTRNLRVLPHWDDAADIVRSSALEYASDKWATQSYRPQGMDRKGRAYWGHQWHLRTPGRAVLFLPGLHLAVGGMVSGAAAQGL